jgi:isoquinoline 1-oxidoreductase
MSTAIVNGKTYELDERHGSLLRFLREGLGLTGAKPACGEGQCGACTVLVDGAPVFSCQTRVEDVADRSVTTIEGLPTDGHLHPIQQALIDEAASQCGYCTPGMALRGAALLDGCKDPDEDLIVSALNPNLCRCGCYKRLVQAVQHASAALRSGAGDAGAGDADGTRLEAGAGAGELPRPRKPWDLCDPHEREWFDVLGDGLVVVWPPQTPPEGAWPMVGGGAWLHVSPSGLVTAFSGKVDVGQDNQTAFRLLVAEELAWDVGAVRVVQGDTDLCPFDVGTFGSRSMPDAGEALRRVAAGTHQILSSLAAEGWPAAASAVPMGRGPLIEAPERPLVEHCELLAGVRRVEVLTNEPALVPPGARRLVGQLGHEPSRLDVVTGRRRFVSDLQLPGMLHGAVLRPPVPGAMLEAVDTTAARQLAAVTVVADGDFVGVCAESPGAARQALALVKAEWRPPVRIGTDLPAYLRSNPTAGAGWERAVDEAAGDVEGALAAGRSRVEATYKTAYIAHVPLETRAAVARWDDGRLTVWTGTQVPFGVRRQLADAFGLDEADVRVIVPPTGGGFGGKHGGDVATEAARLARAAGRAVRVHWDRVEEFYWGRLRPMAVIDVRAALDGSGSLAAWDFLDVNAGPAALGSAYSVADRRLRYQPAASPLAQSSYRALGANANNFARECLVDELAHEVGADPVAFRLDQLGDERLVTALRAAAGRFGWAEASRTPEAGQVGRGGTAETAVTAATLGQGVAVGLEKGGRVATCAEVRVEPDGRAQVTRLVTAYDCGTIVNRDTVVNQVEGATMMALGGALFEEVPWEDGWLGELSLSRYRVPRFADLPSIDVVLLDRPDLPSAGAGETPMIAVAPAIANAIFSATGHRLRSLPLVPTGKVPLS